MESRFLDGKEDAEKVREYRALIGDIESLVAETRGQEDDILLMRHKIKTMDADDGPGHGFRARYAEEKRRAEDLEERLERVEQDIRLAPMTEDEARDHLQGKLRGVQCQTEKFEDEASLMQLELEALKEMQAELRSELRTQSSGAGAHERLFRQEREAMRYLERLPVVKSELDDERARLISSIEGLRAGISEGKRMSETELLSRNEMDLMKDEVEFTGRHLGASQETTALLRHQKKARVEEVSRDETIIWRRTCSVSHRYYSVANHSSSRCAAGTYRHARRSNPDQNRGARKPFDLHEGGYGEVQRHERASRFCRVCEGALGGDEGEVCSRDPESG